MTPVDGPECVCEGRNSPVRGDSLDPWFSEADEARALTVKCGLCGVPPGVPCVNPVNASNPLIGRKTHIYRVTSPLEPPAKTRTRKKRNSRRDHRHSDETHV